MPGRKLYFVLVLSDDIKQLDCLEYSLILLSQVCNIGASSSRCWNTKVFLSFARMSYNDQVGLWLSHIIVPLSPQSLLPHNIIADLNYFEDSSCPTTGGRPQLAAHRVK